MEERRLVIIGVGAVLAVSTITLLAVTMSGINDEVVDGSERENRTNPLLVISLDGFRSDYIFRYAPTLKTLAKNGVKARFMMPSYPTVTFPNHYTIVTGLYPESHGIVANNFYDPEFNDTFHIYVKNGTWWGGEPIWNTLTRQNKTSATYFWPGSDTEISGQYPTEWRMFNKDVPFEHRVDQVVEWLSRSVGRPDWVSLYFSEPDGAGHIYGPNTFEVDNMVAYVDGMISRLLTGLRRNNMEDKVNIIVLADHGMATAGHDKAINLTDYVPDLNSSTSSIFNGAFTMLSLKDSGEEAKMNMLTNLSCPDGAPYIRAFLPQDLPTRFHYSNNRRIADIVLDFDSGYYTKYPDGFLENGEHGYDNHFSTMSAVFIATGPDFQKNVTLEPFQNIEIYNLMCLLTGVEPAPNNGTEGSLYAALLDPPPVPELPVEDEPETPAFPPDLTINDERLKIANCRNRDDNLTESELQQLQELNINASEQQNLVNFHLPWGIPLSGDLPADIILLHHKDHVTGYSQMLKMPLWTSFTVSAQTEGTPYNESLWVSDARLNVSTTATCDSYANAGVFMHPLFPPKFSANETLDLIPYLVSNSVPTTPAPKTFDYVDHLLTLSQMQQQSPVNVMIGPVFDNDADSLPDDFNNFTIPEVPSDIFVITTHCRQPVASLHDCKNESLKAASIIVPVNPAVNNNCRKDVNYGDMYICTVHDVELVTGLTFFPDLEASARLQLALQIHRSLQEFH